ncbi:MAG: hypothetical protein VB126_08925 [Paludibacter sp.]|nr:hypothetical protein [Paludibacter sp.]
MIGKKRKYSIVMTIILMIFNCSLSAQKRVDNRVIGVFFQQFPNKLILTEFSDDLTFNYHVMSERAYKKTSGKYTTNGDTLILNSDSVISDFDFRNKKMLIISRKKINTESNKLSQSYLLRSRLYNHIPQQQSDFKNKIDSIKSLDLAWIKDTTNYENELKLTIHDPLPPKEPLIIVDGIVWKYNFLLNYITMKEIDSIYLMPSDKVTETGLYGERTKYGIIIVKRKIQKSNT